MREPEGWIVELGEDGFHHRFGGDSWTFVGASAYDACDVPALLLTFDLHDPRLRSLSTLPLDELPVCSFINSNIWEQKQVFEILPHLRALRLLSSGQENPIGYAEEDRLLNHATRH
jgi:hypothetical protein